MDQDLLRYDLMVEEALRGVVREALARTAEQGLPGSHHFYITFRTDGPGVEVPERLRERYPTEMTIVLQHRFWGLEVDQAGFAVTLSFNDLPERLVVPFEAVTAFADPSVRFVLQFGQGAVAADGGQSADQTDAAEPSQPDEEAAKDPATGSADKVVTLDRFRRKP